MLSDIVLLAVLLLAGGLVFVLLMKRRRSNALPVNEPDDSLARLVRHLDDL